MRTMLVDTLLDLRDPDLYDYLRDAVATGFIRSDFYNVDDLDNLYAGRLLPSKTGASVDPMSIFSYHYGAHSGSGRPDGPWTAKRCPDCGELLSEDHDEPLMESAAFALPRHGVPEPIIANRKTGRNEPCPCGSGRKYKKCCMRG